MAWFISNPVESESQGPNATMLWISSSNEYRINIPWGGHRSVPITYCPWCGTRLPESLEQLWYETLYALGFQDPGNDDDIPPAFVTDEWWRNPVPFVPDPRASGAKDAVLRSVLLGLDLHPYDIQAMSHEAQLAAIAAAADDGRLLPGQVALLRNLGLLPALQD